MSSDFDYLRYENPVYINKVIDGCVKELLIKDGFGENKIFRADEIPIEKYQKLVQKCNSYVEDLNRLRKRDLETRTILFNGKTGLLKDIVKAGTFTFGETVYNVVKKFPFEVKLCSQCKKEKPVSDFGKDKYRKDGLSYRCKECAKKSSKTYYRKKVKRPTHKTCTKCGMTKPMDSFSNAKNGKWGHSAQCKECDSKYQRNRNRRKSIVYKQKEKGDSFFSDGRFPIVTPKGKDRKSL